jgi:small subunit ribosomal protein S1
MSKQKIKPQQFCTFDPNLINSAEYLELVDSQEVSLEALYQKKTGCYKVNSIVTGIVLAKEDEGVSVDISYKSNGFVPAYEFNPVEFKEIKTGDTLEVMIEELENKTGPITLSYEKAKAARTWQRIADLYRDNKPVEGVVTAKVKGGLYVDIGITVFLPGSQIDTQRVTDFDQWIGQKIQAYIVKLMPKRGNVIISRRKYMHEQKSEVRKGIIENLSEGLVVNGIVKNITKYGAFIDIGGVDGLLHITDMTWSRIEDPTEIIAIGQTIPVKILSFDKGNEKISLGMKQLTENPWDNLPESIIAGSVIKGTVISIKDYGIFVEYNKGIEGLVHISEISWTNRINDLHKYFKVGQEVEAVVVSLERKNRRMSLSIKQLEKNPWNSVVDDFEVGRKVTGKVTNIADFGFFVQLAPGVDGLVHISDISWTQHIKHPSDIYKKDDIVEAIITDINKQKRKISLSIKGLTENPWNKIAEQLTVGTQVVGTVIKIAEFGAFIRLKDSDIEAFIHSSECSDTPNTPIDSTLKVGQELTFKVIRLAPEEQKIGLSLKTKQQEKRQFQPRSNNNANGDNQQKQHDRPYNPNRSSNSSNYQGNKDNKKPRRDGHSNNHNHTPMNAQSEGGKNNKSALQKQIERLMQQQKDENNKGE